MRSKLLYVSLFPLLPAIALIILSTRVIDDPEQKIIGTWEEVSWRYEKMDHKRHTHLSLLDELDDGIKSEIGGHLVIHKAEIWQFSADRTINFTGNKVNSKTASWSLKGRGNILELVSSEHPSETYLIQELTNERMILHYNSDLQVRGIVEMEFRRRTH